MEQGIFPVFKDQQSNLNFLILIQLEQLASKYYPYEAKNKPVILLMLL